MRINLVLFEPEIPQNTGTLLRTAACLGFELHIIEPCGFTFNHTKLKRAGMDYIDKVTYVRHANWETFLNFASQTNGRLLLMEADTEATPYQHYPFKKDDFIIMGKESTGVSDEVARSCDATITIPMSKGVRSLNMAVSASIVISHALNVVQGAIPPR